MYPMTPAANRLFTTDDRVFLQAVLRAGYANPFTPARVEAEREALDASFVDGGPAAALTNRRRIASRLRPILDAARARLAAGVFVEGADVVFYEEACLSFLRNVHGEGLQPIIDGREPPGAEARVYRALCEDHGRFLCIPGFGLEAPRAPHVFACAFHLRRAHHYLSTLIGTSRPMQTLRAQVWGAIFTRDLRGYLRSCDRKRSDVSTLVTGPSGTGKELVAGTLGRSLYKAYDAERGRFVVAEGADYRGVNLSALSDSLFESELFGHKQGAFTGALKDRKGILELVGMGGALFLDEIGDLALDRQLKLLRVLEERVFQRVGDTVELPFSARVISATHQDLDARVRTGELRLDLYQRLAGLRIVTPSLREQLDAAPEDLTHLVRFFAERIADEDAAPGLVELAVRHIEERLPRYEWPGNVRELRDCVGTLHHGGEFMPLDLGGGTEAGQLRKTAARSSEDPLRSLRLGTLSDDEAAIRYRTHVVALAGNVTDAARRLRLHRNTVTRSLDLSRLNRWRARRPR